MVEFICNKCLDFKFSLRIFGSICPVFYSHALFLVKTQSLHHLPSSEGLLLLLLRFTASPRQPVLLFPSLQIRTNTCYITLVHMGYLASLSWHGADVPGAHPSNLHHFYYFSYVRVHHKLIMFLLDLQVNFSSSCYK